MSELNKKKINPDSQDKKSRKLSLQAPELFQKSINKEALIRLILGQRGSGKSTLCKKLLKQLKPARLVIFDSMNEYSEFGLVIEDIETFIEYIKDNCEGNFRIVFQSGAKILDFPRVCRILNLLGEHIQKEIYFVTEEVDIYCSATSIEPEFQNTISRGRHYNINLIGLSQRPYNINRLLTSQAKIIYTFNHSEPRDILYLKNYIGDEAEKVRTLPKYTCLKYENGIIEIKNLNLTK